MFPAAIDGPSLVPREAGQRGIWVRTRGAGTIRGARDAVTIPGTRGVPLTTRDAVAIRTKTHRVQNHRVRDASLRASVLSEIVHGADRQDDADLLGGVGVGGAGRWRPGGRGRAEVVLRAGAPAEHEGANGRANRTQRSARASH